MAGHHLSKALAAIALSVLTLPVQAEQEAGSGEAKFLGALEGRFSGNGTLRNAGGSSRSLTCKFNGDQQGSRLSLDGSCTTAAIFSATIKIELRHDPKSGRYAGTFRESTGTVASLSGKRQGADLRACDFARATFHLGSSRSGLVGSDIAGEGTRTGFYTDESLEASFQVPEDVRKAFAPGNRIPSAIYWASKAIGDFTDALWSVVPDQGSRDSTPARSDERWARSPSFFVIH